MASDVASQGGGAGQGLHRHRRARRVVGWRRGRAPGQRAGTGAAEPRDRGPVVDPGRRAAAATAQGKDGRFVRGSSGNFMGRFRIDPQSSKCRNELRLHQLGASPLNRLVIRGPRPGRCRQSYVKFIRLGRGDSDIPVKFARTTRTPIRAASDTRGKEGPGGRSDHRAVVGN
jgi:hypothetical protein